MSQIAEALVKRGVALYELMRIRDASESFDKALSYKFDAGVAFYRGLCALLLGDLSRGWLDYEYRWNCRSDGRTLNAPFPVWRGEDISGKRIVVYEEQGLGDIIQISRYLNHMSAQGAMVTFLVRPAMHKLLSSLTSSIRILAAYPVGETFDYQCAMMSLPLAFKTTASTIPPLASFEADQKLVADWRRRIGADGFKIGICWRGKPGGTVDLGRSIPLRHFKALASPGVRLISLQKSAVSSAADFADFPMETLGNFDEIDAFIDTAAIMSSLDLIITSDTSIAHLAGALGRPVWVALKFVPDWRWMLARSDSPWYPTMTLYRQTTKDDWDRVFERIAIDLAETIKAKP